MPDCPSYAALPSAGMNLDPESPPRTPFNINYGVVRPPVHHQASFVPPRSAPPNQHGFPDGNNFIPIPVSASGTASGSSAPVSDYAWSTGSSLSPDIPHLQNPRLSHSRSQALPLHHHQHNTAAQHISPTVAYESPFNYGNNHSMIEEMNALSPQGTINAASPP
ncbi:hypothetical protein KEM54_004826, partial [Ascosphaera aggregata]